MKTARKISIIALLVVTLAVAITTLYPNLVVQNIQQRTEKLQQRQTADAPVLPTEISDVSFIRNAITVANPKLPAARIELLIKLLDTVAADVFDSQDHRMYWIALIGVESAYDSSAKSPKNAVGLGQLLPQFRDDFGKTCGLTGFSKTDVLDDFTNAYLSACYFRDLLGRTGNSVPLALVAYNAGPSSLDLKRLSQGSSPSHEPAAYAAKVWAHKEKADEVAAD